MRHALVEIEQLENFELLLLARCKGRHRHIEPAPGNGMRSRNSSRAFISFFQSMIAGASARLITRFLGTGKRRHQREVLVDHADAERRRGRSRGLRIVTSSPPSRDVAAIGRVEEPMIAFDERRLAGAVLAEQGVEFAGPRPLSETSPRRDQRAENLGHAPPFRAEIARLLGPALWSGLRRRSRQMLQE